MENLPPGTIGLKFRLHHSVNMIGTNSYTVPYMTKSRPLIMLFKGGNSKCYCVNGVHPY